MNCSNCSTELVSGEDACGSCRRPAGEWPAPQDRPLRFPSAASWLIAGMTRNLRGATVALVCAWFNVPFAVLCGLLGAVLAGLVGFVSGALGTLGIPVIGDALPNGAFQIGGLTGTIAGAFTGMVGGVLVGLLGPWLLLSSVDLGTAIGIAFGQLLAGSVIGALSTLCSVATEPLRLKAAGVRRLSRRERELVMPIAVECARRLGIDGIPRLLIDDRADLHAYALSRHIVVHRGLLDEFCHDPDVLAAVICHELAHWNNADPIAAAFVRGVALPLYIPYQIATAMLRVARGPLLMFGLWLFMWPFLFTTRYLVMPMQAADSRKAEYRADRAAKQAGHLAGMRRFLSRTGDTVDGARDRWDDAVHRTHPPTELRLERLELAGEAYSLPDLDAPIRPLPVTITPDSQPG
ncbi:zinc metalloprotease HtpX [Actinomadura luteofluorescens]|uniref:M48 family metalloprotease n=1 Tax=Actinomadura luteofluorescens TaxID=46163 RepID=UPI00216465AF|nr:M48 family metalloprotease [Actinomadura glauciflava]MCR3743963.1 Zn-dependent protease with chaperone function [Actinomadura glauciflava]